MEEKNILYKKTKILKNYIYGVIFSLPVVFLISLDIIYGSVSIYVFLIIIPIFLLLLFFMSTEEYIVYDDRFEVNYHICFNLILKESKLFNYSEISKIELDNGRWGLDFDPFILFFIPNKIGKKIIIHFISMETEEISEISLNKSDTKMIVDLINDKLIEHYYTGSIKQ